MCLELISDVIYNYKTWYYVTKLRSIIAFFITCRIKFDLNSPFNFSHPVDWIHM